MKFRVIKCDWEKKVLLFISEPMEFEECLEMQRPMIKDLAPRGEDTKLIKIYEDKGEDFDYVSCGGYFIYLYREPHLLDSIKEFNKK